MIIVRTEIVEAKYSLNLHVIDLRTDLRVFNKIMRCLRRFEGFIIERQKVLLFYKLLNQCPQHLEDIQDDTKKRSSPKLE